MIGPAEARLRAALDRHDTVVVAVSGGVDSMTLAYLAHLWRPDRTRVFHAVSPAVPAEATARVGRHADRHGWRLEIGGSGEFEDARYRANPVDRCYFCKTNLYDRIRALLVDGTIASGANTDDLDDYRPGLKAAAERGIVHPFIEAGLDKDAIRALSRHHGLDDIAELPAQPCLASRIETGIAISAEDLAFVNAAEIALSPLMPHGAALRCRVTRAGIVVEVPEEEITCAPLLASAGALCTDAGRTLAGIRAYRRGSAFIGKPADG